jgi:hypothetical protein
MAHKTLKHNSLLSNLNHKLFVTYPLMLPCYCFEFEKKFKNIDANVKDKGY